MTDKDRIAALEIQVSNQAEIIRDQAGIIRDLQWRLRQGLRYQLEITSLNGLLDDIYNGIAEIPE